MWTLNQLGLSISNHPWDMNAIPEMRYPLSDQKLLFKGGHLEHLSFTVRAASYCSEAQIQVIILTEHNTKECSIQYWQNPLMLSSGTEPVPHPASPTAKDTHHKGSQINWSFCKIVYSTLFLLFKCFSHWNAKSKQS